MVSDHTCMFDTICAVTSVNTDVSTIFATTNSSPLCAQHYKSTNIVKVYVSLHCAVANADDVPVVTCI